MTAPARKRIVRNRAITPLFMSFATETAVDDDPNPAQSMTMPGTT